jgi:hypothetical protein
LRPLRFIAFVVATTPCVDAATTTAVVSTADGRTVASAIAQFTANLPSASSITWDTPSTQFISPYDMPPDWYDVHQSRGVVFSANGSGKLRISAGTLSDNSIPPWFGDIDSDYETDFTPHSYWRVFAPRDGNVLQAQFRVTGTTFPALVRGFGVVVVDADGPGAATLECFRGDVSLGAFQVPPAPASGEASFLGVVFDAPVVSRVVIHTASSLGAKDVSHGGNADVVAFDDMLFDHPIPAADLKLSMTAELDGTEIVYTTTVRNPTQAVAAEVVLRQTLAADVVALSSEPPLPVIDQIVTHEVGAIAPGAAETLVVRVGPVKAGFHASSASAQCYNEVDPRDNLVELDDVPGDCPKSATHPSLDCRLRELLGVVGNLPIAKASRKRIAAPISAAAKDLRAAAKRPKSAGKRIAAAEASLGRVIGVLGTKAAFKLSAAAKRAIAARIGSLVGDVRRLPRL